jgi:transporter family protein
MKEWLLPSLFTLIMWGVFGFLPKVSIRYINPISAVVFETAGVMLVGTLLLFFLGFRPDLHPKGVGLAVATGICGTLGALGYLLAVSRGKVSVVVMMTALYPIVTIGLACLFLRESLSLREGIGMVLACLAIVLFAG